MKPASTSLILLLACGLGAAGGWFAAAGGNSRGPSSGSEGASPAKSRKVAEPSTRDKKIPPEVQRLLAPYRAARTPEERMRALTALAEALPVADLAAWYEAGWIPRGGSMESLQFYHVTGSRWLAEDAEGMVRHHLAKDRARLMAACSDWGRRDPSAAFKFLDGVKDPADFELLLASVGERAAAADPAAAVDAIGRYRSQLEHTAETTVPSMIARIADADPELLLRESAGWSERLRRAVEEQVARAMLEKDFSVGVARLADAPNATYLFFQSITSSHMLDQVMANHERLPPGWLEAALSFNSATVVGLNPERFLNMDFKAMGLSDEAAAKCQERCALTLVARQPERLVEFLDSIPWSAGGRVNAIEGVFYGLMWDREAAEAAISRLSRAEDVAIARRIIDSHAKSEAISAQLDSPSKIGVLASAHGQPFIDGVDKMRGWDEQAVREASEAMAKLAPEQRVKLSWGLVETNHVGWTPWGLRGEAFEYLLEAPDTGMDEPESQAFERFCRFSTDWSRNDPRAAAQWAAGLPKGEARLWAAKNVAAVWERYSPEEARAWVASLDIAEEVGKR